MTRPAKAQLSTAKPRKGVTVFIVWSWWRDCWWRVDSSRHLDPPAQTDDEARTAMQRSAERRTAYARNRNPTARFVVTDGTHPDQLTTAD